MDRSAEEFAKEWEDGSFNLLQPWIFMSFRDLDDIQIFIVVDIRILCELNTMPKSFNRHLHAIFVLLATHSSFNITYKKSQHLYCTFKTSFFLVLCQRKKHKNTSTLCMTSTDWNKLSVVKKKINRDQVEKLESVIVVKAFGELCSRSSGP